MTVKIYIVNEVTAFVEGLSDYERQHVIEGLKLPVPGSYTFASFKLGEWDGKESTMTEDGFFPLFQIDEVASLLAEIDITDIDLEDLREPIKHPTEENELPVITEDYFSEYGVTLWEHQVRCLQAILRVDRGLVDAATSSGKGLIGPAIAKLYEPYYPSISITLNNKLAKELVKAYEGLGMECTLIESKKPPKKRQELIKNAKHIVITRKLAVNHADDLDGFHGTLVVDESHVLGDNFFNLVTNQLADCPIRVGLSGSFPSKRKDPLKLQKIKNMICGDIVEEVIPKELMEKGHASTIDVRVVKVNDANGLHKYQEVGSRNWDWPMEENHLNRDQDRIESIAEFIKSNCSRNTLILCRPELGFKLAEEIGCDFVDGMTSEDKREECYSKFDHQDDYILVSTPGVSGVGLSIDLLHFGVLIDIGSNSSVAGQAIGRFLRKDHKNGKKDHAIVWDIYSNLKYSSRQKSERMRYYKERGFKVQDNYHQLTP